MTEEKLRYPLYYDYFKPALEWVVGLGNAVVLAVFFRVAADQLHNPVVSVLAWLMIAAVGGYAGVPLGLAFRPLSRVKTTRLWLGLLITIPLAIGMAYAANLMGHVGAAIVRQMAKSTMR